MFYYKYTKIELKYYKSWAGRDSNPRSLRRRIYSAMCLTASHTYPFPYSFLTIDAGDPVGPARLSFRLVKDLSIFAGVEGLEPTTHGLTVRCSEPTELHSHISIRTLQSFHIRLKVHPLIFGYVYKPILKIFVVLFLYVIPEFIPQVLSQFIVLPLALP